ncbi:hypothetical protein L3X38_043937 [Prunus dulcis]|uniref:Uncharacterized protein n=1 Tax=Prunus dulcis TaxID=3755 RepID=A0AAD4UZG1_PRUDU|nr:hypothetical protein L3X38_043937 [Prunus dulcis]
MFDSDVGLMFLNVYQMVETQFHARIQVDNGGEWNPEFLDVLYLSTYMITNEVNWIPELTSLCIKNDRLPVESNRSPPLSSSTTENLLQNDRSPADSDWAPEENDQLSPRFQNHEEEIEPFYEILPASAPVMHQSPTDEVIQVISFLKIDNTNEISHDDLISEDTEPTYQLLERKNRGKPRVHYKAYLKAKGKYLSVDYQSHVCTM